MLPGLATADDTVVLPAELRRPRPTTPLELAELLRDVLAFLGAGRTVAETVTIDVELAGQNIARLSIAASGIVLPSLSDLPPTSLPTGEIAELPVRLDEFSVLGSGVRWEQAEFDGELRFTGLSFSWLLYEDELVGVRFDEADARDARGSLRLETDLDRLVESIRVAAGRQVRQYGVQLRRLRLRATELGGRSYRVHGEAAAR